MSDFIVLFSKTHAYTMIMLIFGIAIAYLIYHHFTKYNNYWIERNIPGPKPVFFFGNIKDLFFRRKAACEIFKEIYDEYPEEKVVGIFRMRTPDLLVKDHDIIKNILIKDFDAFVERGIEFDGGGIGTNLFHADGETWRLLRNRFTPIFSMAKMKNMMYLIEERGDLLVDYLEKITRDKTEHESHEIVRKFTQANIAACFFGIHVDTFREHQEILDKLEPKIFNYTYIAELDMMYPGILRRIGGSLFPKDVNDFFSKLTEDVIAQRNGKPSGRNDFIDVILTLREAKQISGRLREGDDTEKILEVTDEIIAAQLFIFYAAGYETTASTLGFMFYHLALNPDVQEKAVAEIRDVLRKHGGKLTFETVSELEYAGKIFDETLRISGVSDTIRRRARIDYKIPGMDLIIEKGQQILIPTNVVHKDEKVYPNPEMFDPERFSPENIAARHLCSYLPFGLGSRQCIGYRFAKIQAKVCMAKVLSNFRLEPSKNTPKRIKYAPARIVQYAEGGLPINLIRRQ